MNELLNRLKPYLETRGHLSALSREAGVNHVTILKIAQGRTKNPGVLTMQKIEAALAKLAPELVPAAVPGEA